MTARRARVGVVGTGWWCTRAHLPSLASYGRADVTAVTDIDRDRAESVAERFGVPRFFTDHTAMLAEDLDVVVVATPPVAHFEPARDALVAGADVMVEKPMVIDPDEGRQLVDLARANGRRLHVGYPFIHSQCTAELARIVADGRLGDLRLTTSLFASSAGMLYSPFDEDPNPPDAMFGPRFQTYGLADQGGGQAHGQMTHSVSLMLHVTGVHPHQASAYTTGSSTDVDMVDAVAVTTTEGPLATLSSTGTVPSVLQPFAQLVVFGLEGHAVLDSIADELRVSYVESDGPDTATFKGEGQYPEHLPSRHLVDCFLDETEPLANGTLGLATTILVDAILRSADSHESVLISESTGVTT